MESTLAFAPPEDRSHVLAQAAGPNTIQRREGPSIKLVKFCWRIAAVRQTTAPNVCPGSLDLRLHRFAEFDSRRRGDSQTSRDDLSPSSGNQESRVVGVTIIQTGYEGGSFAAFRPHPQGSLIQVPPLPAVRPNAPGRPIHGDPTSRGCGCIRHEGLTGRRSTMNSRCHTCRSNGSIWSTAIPYLNASRSTHAVGCTCRHKARRRLPAFAGMGCVRSASVDTSPRGGWPPGTHNRRQPSTHACTITVHMV